MLENIKKEKIKFFLLQSNDPWMILFKEFYFGYLLNLLIFKLSFTLENIFVEIVFPFKKYLDTFFQRLNDFDEEYFVFYLENSYHSNVYWLKFLYKCLDQLEKGEKQHKIIIYSLKISSEDSKNILKKYPWVKIILRTEIEYFFYERFLKKTPLESISNILFSNNWNIIETKKEQIDYNLEEYILWGHYSWFLNKYSLSKDYIINILDDDNEYTTNLISTKWPKIRKIKEFRDSPETIAMLSTWRWCKYNCIYCSRWVKFSKIRQIPLDIIKKDLDYLKWMYYSDIYLYDDCFLSTNYYRLDEIINLLSSYDFYYGISIRYEICNYETFQKLQKLNFYRVQIWLQSTNIKSNITVWRWLNKEKFLNLVNQFKQRGVIISVDIILWLPWESLKDFIDTLNYAISLNPWRIHINTLFINPNTELSKNVETYWIVTNEWNNWLFSVPTLLYSDTFSKIDMELAKDYVWNISKKIKNTIIILR
jgi:hypothetical protein